jgi:hypothetical protein
MQGMGKYTKWITYKDKRILIVDVARLDEAKIIAGFEEMQQELFKDRGAPLLLIDISGIDMTTAVINKAKELTAATKEAGIQDGPNVIVGLTGLQKAVAQLFARNVHFSGSVVEAREWLVKQGEKRR